MNQRGSIIVSTFFKQSLILGLILSSLVQQARADVAPVPEKGIATAPAEAPVQLGWDRVGDRERNWA